MDDLETVLARLAATRVCGYHPDSPAAAEPTALVALALLAHGRDSAAQRHVDRLLALRGPDGSVGIERAEEKPGWPTGLAVLAWRAAQKSSIFDVAYVSAIDHALGWILETQGTLPEHVDFQGRDTTVRGWPWAAGTYSWVEPTAMNLLALKHFRYAAHSRAREAVLLLVNRLLDRGGCNYGNTVVFGQTLRPHLQPTGICLLALAGEEDTTGRIGRSVDYLNRELSENTASASLSYGLLGLAAHGAYPRRAGDWLQAAAHRTLARDPSSYKLALLALSALGSECPLISRVQCLKPQDAAGREPT
ncbi:MAG: hypothetical protein WD063_03430 [Pirellulales bacterium]